MVRIMTEQSRPLDPNEVPDGNRSMELGRVSPELDLGHRRGKTDAGTANISNGYSALGRAIILYCTAVVLIGAIFGGDDRELRQHCRGAEGGRTCGDRTSRTLNRTAGWLERFGSLAAIGQSTRTSTAWYLIQSTLSNASGTWRFACS